MVVALSAAQVMAEESQGDRFRFSVNTRADYTDNRDAWEADEESNWDFYIRPRADVLFETESTLLDLYYAPSFRYRTDPSNVQNDNEIHHDLGINVKHKVSRRLVLRLMEKFDLTDDAAVSDDGATVRGDRSYYLNTFGGSIDMLAAKRTEVDIYARNTIKRYDEDVVASTSDEDRTDVGAKLTQHLSNNMRVTLESGYSMFGYESPGMIMRDFDSLLLAAGGEKVLSNNLTVGGQVGAQMQSYDDDGIDDSTNPFAKLFVRGNTSPSLRLSGTLTHAVRDADAYPFASQEYSELRGVVDWDTTPQVTLTLSGIYRLSDYEDVVPSAAALADFLGLTEGDETTIDVYGQAAYKVTDSCTLLLRQRFEDVDSDISTSYNKNTTTLELTKFF